MTKYFKKCLHQHNSPPLFVNPITYLKNFIIFYGTMDRDNSIPRIPIIPLRVVSNRSSNSHASVRAANLY